MQIMKASVRRSYQTPLQIESIDKPIPKDSEILIKVEATTVNRTDCAVLTGKPYIMRLFTGLSKPKRITPGTDFAGVVVETGKDVSQFKVNDKVFGFKDDGIASQAEFICIPEKGNVLPMPKETNYDIAVASIEGAHYAYNFIKKIQFQKGQKILINGTSGAIGSAMLQLVKIYDVEITAVCNTQNIAKMGALGADKTIDYLTTDFTLSSEKYDYVLDAVGKSTFGKCKGILKPKGIYISSELGPNAQNLFFSIRSLLWGKKKVQFPFPTDIKGSIRYITQLIEAKQFSPMIDRHYPLKDISEAYKYVQSEQKSGNVILKISD